MLAFKLSPQRFKSFEEIGYIATSSSLFIAANAALLTVSSFLLYGIKIDPAIILCSFLVTFSAYNVNKITDSTEDHANNPKRQKLVKKSGKTLIFVSAAAVTVSILIGAAKNVFTALVLISPFIVALFYSLKISPSTPRLKEVPGVKSLSVALSWALTGSLLPATLENVSKTEVILTFTFIFVTLLVNTVLFDVRDIRGDYLANVKTIPIILGLKGTEKFLLTFNSLLIPLLIFSFTTGQLLKFLPALTFGMAYNFLLIKIFCREINSKSLLVDLIVDGEWIPLTTAFMINYYAL